MQKITWDGVEIEINYEENFSNAHKKIYGERMCHIEIYAKEDIPITDTGYKSIFILESKLDEWGGVEKYIRAELEHGSKSPEWEFRKESKKQLCLF